MKKGTKKSIRDNLIFPMIVAVASSMILTFLGTRSYDDNIRYVEYVSFNSISSLLKADFVDTDLVNASVLDKETPKEQLTMIGEAMQEQKKIIEVETKKNEELSGTVAELMQKNGELSSLLSSQPTVDYSDPPLVIKGEEVDTTLKDYIATINGKNYYQEALLNTYILDAQLSVNDGKLTYDVVVPERVKAVTDAVIHDIQKFSVVKETSDAMMGTKLCTYGFTSGRWGGDADLYIECGGQYSQLEFGLGHVNNSGDGNKTLNIYYLDSDGEYVCAYTKKLSKDMGYIEKITVDIYNTQTVKIEIPSYYCSAQYGITDVYLVK